MLLKRLFPREDALVVEQIAKVVKHLHSIPLRNSSNFPRFGKWLKALHDKGNSCLPEKHLQNAKRFFVGLVKTQGALVFFMGKSVGSFVDVFVLVIGLAFVLIGALYWYRYKKMEITL